jgi:hypothetical protein
MAAPAREIVTRVEVARFIERPFDVGRPPLIRALLITEEADRHTLLVVEHHLVHDGYAFALVQQELIDRYEGRPVTAPSVTYGDYARWQREHLVGAFGERLWAFWADRLRDLPPTWPCEQTAVTGQARVLRRTVRQDSVDAARAAVGTGAGTLFTLFMAALQLVVAQRSGQHRLCLGMAVANRAVPGTDRVLGPFVNVVPLVADVAPETPLGTYLHRTNEQVLAALAHQEAVLSTLIRRLGRRSMGTNPLFQVMMGFDDGPVPEFRLGDCVGHLRELQNGDPKLALSLVVVPQQEQRAGTGVRSGAHVDIIWEYADGVLTADDVEAMARDFDDVLAEIAGTASADGDSRRVCDTTGRIAGIGPGPRR